MTEEQFEKLCLYLNVKPEELEDPEVLQRAACLCAKQLDLRPPYDNPRIKKKVAQIVNIALANVLDILPPDD